MSSTRTKWTIMRYDPSSASPRITDLATDFGFSTPDDMRLQWDDPPTIVFLEMWYNSNSYLDQTTYQELLEQFNVPAPD